MTRNTHDLNLDHHGAFTTGAKFTDQGSDPSSPASGLHTVYSKADGLYIKDSSGDVIGPLGIGGGGAGILDLLTGDDSEFTTSVGNWTNSGGTLARDTTAAYLMDGLTASLKFTTTAQYDYVEVPVAGTFLAGHEYHAAIALEAEPNVASNMSYNLQFGLLGTDARSLSASGNVLSIGSAQWLVANWIPTADRTGVKLRLSRAGAETGTVIYHISWARVSEVGLRSVGLFAVTKPNGSSTQMIGTVFQSSTIAYGRNAYELTLARDWGSLTDGNWTTGVYSYAPGYVWMWGEHTPSDKAQTGIQLQAGSDYLGFYISQKDASTLQMYADADHSIELEDSATGGWKFVSGDGAVAWPAKGKRPQYSSAPSTPAEGQSYYDTTDHKEYVWNGTSWVELGGGTGMSNPMTTAGDLIIGGTSGAPARLAATIDDYVLTLASGSPVWAAAASGFADPTTTKGDLIVHGASTTRLGVGTDGQVLVADSAQTLGVKWDTPASSGMTNPMTTEDDIIVGSTAGAAARLAKGTDGQVLTIDPTTHHVVWDDPAAGASALDDLTDVVITTPADGQILTYDSGSSMWVNADAPTGGGGGFAGDRVKYTGGNITTATSGTDKIAVSSTNLDVTVAAAVGDVLQYAVTLLMAGSTVGEVPIDAATVVSSAFVNYISGGSSTSGGLMGLYHTPQVTNAQGLSAVVQYTVQSGDVENGNVTLRLVYRPAGTGSAKTIYATSAYPLDVSVVNLGVSGGGGSATAEVSAAGRVYAYTNFR